MVQGETRAVAAAQVQPAGGGRPVDGQGHRTGQDEHVVACGRDEAAVDSVEQRTGEPVPGVGGVLQVQVDLALEARRTS